MAEERPGLRARLAQWSVTRWLAAIASVAALAAIGLAALLLSLRPRPGCGGFTWNCGGCSPGSPASDPAPSPSGAEGDGGGEGSAPDTASSGCGSPDFGCSSSDGGCGDSGGCGDEGCGEGPSCGDSGGCGDEGCGEGPSCGAGGGCGDAGGGCGSGGGGGGCDAGGGGGDCSSYLTAAPPHADLLAGLPLVLRSAPPPSRSARLGVLAIRAYQRWLSPRLGARCRYTPSCSQYALYAIQRYGLAAGAQLATARIRRCTHRIPLGTPDPVPGSA